MVENPSGRESMVMMAIIANRGRESRRAELVRMPIVVDVIAHVMVDSKVVELAFDETIIAGAVVELFDIEGRSNVDHVVEIVLDKKIRQTFRVVVVVISNKTRRVGMMSGKRNVMVVSFRGRRR